MESSLYRNDSTFLKNTIIQSGPKIWLHLYIETIPHFLRKQYFHIKCVLFHQCNQYGIKSISVIDASLWIHLQESESLLCQLYWTGWIIVGEFYSKNSPKHDPCFKDACIFIAKLKWPTSTVKKHWPLPDLTGHYKRYLGQGILNVV